MNQGLKLLAVEAQKSGVNFQESKRVVILPFYSFLDSVYELLKKYISNPHFQSWAQFLSIQCNDRQISNIFGKISTQIQGHGSNIVSIQCSVDFYQCSYLSVQFPNQKLFSNSENNILLKHEDVIGILHNVFSSTQSRRTLSEGIKSLFINFKMQPAKIYSCVFIQYVLSLHDTIQSREKSEATVQNQTGNYGMIPKSILCSSELAIHPPSKPAISYNIKEIGEQNFGSNHENNSNFQSALHDENGLYRKVRPQQLNFQRNDHIKNSFIQTSNSKMAVNKSHISTGRPKSRALLIAETKFYQNEKSRSSSPQRKTERKQKQKKGLEINGKEQKFSSKIFQTMTKASEDRLNAYHKQNTQSRLINDIEVAAIKNSKNQSNFKDFIKPLTYSERTNPPFESEDKANLTSKLNGDIFKQKQNIFDTDKQPHWRNGIENPEQHKQQSKQQVKQIQGGFVMFKKLMQKNRTISEQILNNEFVKRKESLIVDDEGNVNFELPESISVIHDSIVRHSKADRWNVTAFN